MPKWLLLFFAVPSFAACAYAAPVHITLKTDAAVVADADGFFDLASVAQLSGGSAETRKRMGAAEVGRAPLPDVVRHLTTGDIALKLRQAGFHPEHDAVLDGSPQIAVTLSSVAAPTGEISDAATPPASASSQPAPLSSPIVIKPGMDVVILLQDGCMAIRADGTAREAGHIGDVIRVHRDGVPTDLSATIIDSQTVSMEVPE